MNVSSIQFKPEFRSKLLLLCETEIIVTKVESMLINDVATI